MKKLLTLALAVMLLFTMAGCSGDISSKLVGSWEGDYAESNEISKKFEGTDFSTSIKFEESGIFTMGISNNADSPKVSGTWAVTENGDIILESSGLTFKGKLTNNKLSINMPDLGNGNATIIYKKK